MRLKLSTIPTFATPKLTRSLEGERLTISESSSLISVRIWRVTMDELILSVSEDSFYVYPMEGHRETHF